MLGNCQFLAYVIVRPSLRNLQLPSAVDSVTTLFEFRSTHAPITDIEHSLFIIW